jgi:NodT family efflux transporter outer membrane factor (OMF) lipoprotein
MNVSPPHRRPASALLLALLSACTAEPPPPIDDALGIDIPPHWTSASAADANRPDATAPALPEAWWQGFGDAQLDAAVERALLHNRDLQAAMARLEGAAAARTIAGGPAWPELDANLDAQRNRRLFLGFPFGGGGVPSATFTSYGLALSLRWELDVWGRIRAGSSASIADQQAALADLQGARQSLVAQVCRAWFAAVEARQQLDLATATVATFRATADDVRDRFRRGVRPALEVHQAETNLATAEANAAQRRDALQRARRQVDVLVGRYPDGRTAAGATLPTQLPAVPAGLPGELLLRRPDLVAAERRVAAAGCRVEAARAALYPRLSLTGSAGTNSLELEDLVDDDFRIWSIGGNLLAPLFRGGALRADVEQKLARRAEVFATYGSAVLRAFAEVEDVLGAEVELSVRAERQQAAAASAASAHELARQRYQSGLTDFLTVADAQRQAFASESNRLSTARQRLDNRIDLFLALGGGYGRPASGANP